MKQRVYRQRIYRRIRCSLPADSQATGKTASHNIQLKQGAAAIKAATPVSLIDRAN
jgi:hypothetical protein